MGTGKTTVGKILAEMLGFVYVDSDDEIVRVSGETIVNLFTQLGEARFREFETEIIRTLSQLEKVVIGCGGGVVINQENIKMLHDHSKIFLLTASSEEILQRINEDLSRPLLNTDNKLKRIIELMKARNNYYLNAADIIIDTEKRTPLEVTNEILKQLGEDL